MGVTKTSPSFPTAHSPSSVLDPRVWVRGAKTPRNAAVDYQTALPQQRDDAVVCFTEGDRP